ncbi:MAG: oligosaccharide flippase family protein [Desulfatibacillum sp.]|nr:oligosaccharide flippase family protein [Desulfatibacillum sp.]
MQIALIFVMLPFIVHSLGTRMYGFWALAGAFIGYFGLMDLGLATAVVRYVSRATGAGDNEEINQVASTSFFLFSGIGLIALLVTAALAWSSYLFFKSPDESRIFGQVIGITGTGFALGFPMRVFAGLLEARMRQDLQSMASVLRLVLANIMIFVTLSSGHGILAVAASYLIADMLMHGLTAVMAYRILPDLQIRLSLISKDRLGQLFSYGGISFWSRLAGIFQFRTPPILIAIYLNANYVTIFHIGARLLHIYAALIDSVASLGGPMYSWQEARGDMEALRRSFLNFVRISGVLAVFVGASIMFFGKNFVVAWMGADYVSSYMIIMIMGVPAIIAAAQGPAVNLLYSISRHRFLAVINTMETVLGLLLSVLLLQFYGINGVAAALGISILLCKLIVLPMYTCKCVNIPKRDYLKALAIPNLKLLAPLFVWFLLVYPYLKPTYARLFAVAGLQIFIFIPVIYFFVLEPRDRTALAEAIKTRRIKKSVSPAPHASQTKN